MNTTPFQPKGDVAEWRMVYDHARTLNPGDLITYTELAAILGRPDDEPDKLRGPVYRAAKELQRNDLRTFINVKCEGYRIAYPNEHGVLACTHKDKSRTQIGKAIGILRGTDKNGLDAEERKQHDRIESTVLRIDDAVRQIDRRTEKVQQALDAAHTAEMGELSKIIEQQAKMMEAMKRRGILD